MNKRYNKNYIEQQALRSKKVGRLSEPIGKFIIDRSWEIAKSSFYVGNNDELLQILVDEAVMRCCDKFFYYYEPKKSAANLIISMIYSAMYNKIESLNWRDQYGQKIKGRMQVFEDGRWVNKLIKYQKEDGYFN